MKLRTLILALVISGCYGASISKPVSSTAPAPLVIPSIIKDSGGLYIPWQVSHTLNRVDVLACVGLLDTGAYPVLWVAPRPLFDEKGDPLLAVYDTSAHAILFSPDIPEQLIWEVFRHEIIHSVDRQPGHGKYFDNPMKCHFWPRVTYDSVNT